jgi:subtilisin family serine protease
VAEGSSRIQGLFRTALPARSRAVVRSLPPGLLRFDADAAEPILYVKAQIGEEALGPAGLSPRLRLKLDEIGVEVRGRVGGIASLRVPAPALTDLGAMRDIVWLKAAHSYRPWNEVSTGSMHVDSDAANLTLGTGEGVIVAVVDSGIDWTNPEFRNGDGTTRVLGIWDQTITDASHPPPEGFTFGAFYSQADIDAALAASTALMTGDGYGHGTHVAGSAAGNGVTTGNGVPAGTFAGVAPGADLLIVRIFDDAGDFCLECDLTAGVQFIQGIAASEGKPWVGNMSLGADLGAHDGTDPDELTIDAAVGPGRAGAQLAIAAGNRGGTALHWKGTLTSGGTSQNTFQVGGATTGADNDFVWLDLWYESTDRVTVDLIAPNGTTASATTGGESGIVCTNAGAILIDATNAPDPVNGANEVFIQISDDSVCRPVKPPRAGTWTIRIRGDQVAPGGGAFDVWSTATIAGSAPFGIFTLDGTVSVPGTARHALTVGAYVGKSCWIDATGIENCPSSTSNPVVGGVSSFSGKGPTRDGRIKPDLSAPGEWIGSTLSGTFANLGPSFRERDGVHGNLRGTSMATPHVAGAAALALSLNPNLQGPQVKAALREGSQADGFTGAVPNNTYGAGKLLATAGALQAASIVTDLLVSADGGIGATGSPFVDGYNLYRGTIPGISSTDYGTCFLQDLPTPTFTDAEQPGIGVIFTYIVTGVVGGIEGLLGVDGDGQIRPNNSPCL